MLFTTLQHAFLLVYLSPTIRYYLKYATAPYPLSLYPFPLPLPPYPFHLPLPPLFTLPPSWFRSTIFDPPSWIFERSYWRAAFGGELLAGLFLLGAIGAPNGTNIDYYLHMFPLQKLQHWGICKCWLLFQI